MSYKIKNFIDRKEDYLLWEKIISKSSYHWFFSNINYNYFHTEYIKDLNLYVDNKSFFIYESEKLVAHAILIFSKDQNSNLLNASYLNDPLPWPIISDECKNRSHVYQLIFDEIFNRVKESKISKINFFLNTSKFSNELEDEFIKNIRKHNMIDNSYLSHLVEINEMTLNLVRKSYIKNIKRNINDFKVKLIRKDDYYQDLPKDYKILHSNDVGKEVRSLKTYELQLKSILQDKGFAIQIFSDENKLIGMLIIYYENGSAYDGSVAVSPKYKKSYISSLMKYYAILELKKIDIKLYELGKAAISPSNGWIPKEKNYGISFFKNGWSNNKYKKVYLAEKVFTLEALKLYNEVNFENLADLFKIETK